MDIHEYQIKNILKQYRIAIPRFKVVSSIQEVELAIQELGISSAVLKMQVHAGGRGKAGGVKFAKGKEEILLSAHELLGKKIINRQTGPKGLISHQILITEPLEIKKEYYVALTIDRKKGQLCFILSKQGGVDIEETAKTSPKSIHREWIYPGKQVYGFQLFTMAKFLGWEREIRKQGMEILKGLAQLFIETDASLLEINPLVETPQGLFALDAKCSIDDNALFRQAQIKAYFDPTQLTPNEVMAKEFDLAYVGLDGEIGCLVNGAGLAMATMDLIAHHGGKPANFLDVGGSASHEKIAEGFRIILSDSNVKAIFVNIFGGIMDCSVLAEGIVMATQKDQIRVPLIVRMEGTHVEEGKKILKESGLKILSTQTMEEGAVLAVKASREYGSTAP